jgi:hypothetical protein
MPVAPSESVTRTTTHLVTFFETPPLVNVPTRGMPMLNTSTLLIFAVIPDLFLYSIQKILGFSRDFNSPECRLRG